MSTPPHTLEEVYDKYAPILYSIALELTLTTKEAEKLLMHIFQAVKKRKLLHENYPSLCVALIRLSIQIASKKNKGNQSNLKLPQFKNMLFIHKLLCERENLEIYCQENKLSRQQAQKKIREEFNTLRNLIIHTEIALTN